MMEYPEKKGCGCSGRSLPVLVLWIVFLFTLSCSRSEQEKRTGERDSASEELMTCLALVRAHHRQADMYLKMGDVRRAVESVARILNISCPADAPEASGALLDAHARLSELYTRQGEIDKALETARRGLDGYTEDSFFRAHLLMVYGDVLDAKAEAMEAGGDKNGADELRRLAIENLSKSIEINQRLQKELLKDE